MPTATVTSVENLPLMLTMRDVQSVLRCHKDIAYKLPHVKGFPVIRLGKSIRVPRDKFLEWVEEEAEKGNGGCNQG